MLKYSNETEFLWDDCEEDIGYTKIDNYICVNEHVEFNSQGIYLQIVKFKNSVIHKVYMSSLEKTKKGSKRDVQRGILNLRMEGFLIRVPIRDGGRFSGYLYKIRRKPLELTLEQKIEIYNESKVNREYTRKIYGTDFVEVLENHLTSCVSKDSVQNTNCDIGNCDIDDCTTKKENKIKNKIIQKENDHDIKVFTTTKAIANLVNQSSSEIINIDESLIKLIKDRWLEVVNKRLILSEKNKIKLMNLSERFGKEEVIECINRISESDYLKTAISIGHFITKFEDIANGKYTTWLRMEDNMSIPTKQSKIEKFNNMYSHDWNFDSLEILGRLKLKLDLGNISQEEYNRLAAPYLSDISV